MKPLRNPYFLLFFLLTTGWMLGASYCGDGGNCGPFPPKGMAYVAREYNCNTNFSSGESADKFHLFFRLTTRELVDKIVEQRQAEPSVWEDLLPKAYACSPATYRYPPANYIDSLSIRSTTDYTAEYPAGSELLPIFRLTSAYPFAVATSDEEMSLNDIPHISNVNLPIDSLLNLGLYAPETFRLRPAFAPDSAGTAQAHNFNVYLSLSSGEEMNFTLENITFTE